MKNVDSAVTEAANKVVGYFSDSVSTGKALTKDDVRNKGVEAELYNLMFFDPQ